MKPNLILLHGALGSKAQLSRLASLLSDHFAVHSLNFEGHGGRATEQDYSIPLFSGNVKSFMQTHQMEQSHFFGYSMGGYVALHLAKTAPNSVGRIISLGTKFNWTQESAAKEMKMLNPEKIAKKVPAFADYLKQLHHPLDWKDVLRQTATMMQRMGDGERFALSDFQEIDHQVTIGIGDRDQMVSMEESEQVAKALPNGKLKLFAGFEHPIDKVDQEVLAREIIAFIEE